MINKTTLLITTLFVLIFNALASDIFKIKLGWINGTIPADYNVIGLTNTSTITVGTPFALKDSTGGTSTLTFTQKTGTAYQQGVPSPATTGVTYNLPYFTQTACYGWAFAFDASTSFEVGGFTPGDAVEFIIICSRGNNGAATYTTSRLCNLTATGANTVNYNNYEPAGNYTTLATLANVLPDANGKITLTIASAPGSANPVATLMNAIRIKRTAASSATGISISSSSFSGLNYDAGFGPSVEKIFTVNGNGLQSDITVTPPANFEISTTSATGFVSSPIVLTQSGGTLPTTPIYLRLKAGLTPTSYTGQIVLSSTNSPSKNVACSGTVANIVPTFSSNVSSLNGLNYNAKFGPSVERTLTVSGVGLGSDLIITPSANLEISKTTGVGFANAPLAFIPSSGQVAATTIYVRLKAGLNQSDYTESLIISSGTLASLNISCSGIVSASVSSNTNFARTTYVDFGISTYLTNDEGWSNMTGYTTGQFVNLQDGLGDPFGTLTITKGFFGSSSIGTDRTTESSTFIFSGNPSIDFFYGQNTGNSSSIKLTGLNPSSRYDFTILGSRVGVTPVDNREAKYVITGLDGLQTTLLLDATNNVAKSVVAKNVKANAAGEITIDISAGPNNTNSVKGYYINAMKIVEQIGNVVTSSDNQYLQGDIMEPWCGGNAYYSKWSKGLPTSSSFFPITVFYQQTTVAAQYKAVGVNCYNYLGPGTTVSTTSFDNLSAAGVFALNPYSDLYRDFAGNAIIKAWYIDHDEPDNQYGSAVTPVESIMSEYKLMVDKDPTRPVMIGLGQGAAVNSWYGRGDRTNKPRDYRKYSKWADMVSFDCYPMNENRLFDAGGLDYKIRFNTEIANSIWYIANGIDNLREATDYSKPVWVWLECTNMHSLAQFDLQPYHIKAEAWMALIHGANGIGYFCHDLQPNLVQGGVLQAKYSSYLQAISDNNAIIAANAPILNTQTVSNAASVSTNSADNPVDIMVKRDAGFTYIYAVSMRPGTPTATFTLRNFNVSSIVEVVNENRTLVASNGVFQDTFSDYGVHIYKTPTLGITTSEKMISTPNFEIFRIKNNNSIGFTCTELIQSITLYDTSGKCIDTKLIDAYQGEIQISTSNGTALFLRAKTKDNLFVKKILL